MTAQRRPSREVTGRRLMHMRRVHMQTKPLCPYCEQEGRINLGEHLDHTVALANGGIDDKRDPFNNRQLICAEHHRAKTAVDLGKRPKVRIGLDGLPIKGRGQA